MALRPDYYRMEFQTNEGSRTFEFKEEVIIYDVSGTNPGELITDKGDYILTLRSSGFLTWMLDSLCTRLCPRVPTVKVLCGLVRPKGKLVVGDLSDLDPDQMTRNTGDIDY